MSASASMRPPHYTGEDTGRPPSLASSPMCFNEAPALHGGRRDGGLVEDRGITGFNEAPALHGEDLGRHQRRRPNPQASMRPPHYTGEDGAREWTRSRPFTGFNEAPALHGGRRFRQFQPTRKSASFNEAPALHGGRPCGRARRAGGRICFNEAPALHGGRHAARRAAARRERGASMRPPHYTGEDNAATDDDGRID